MVCLGLAHCTSEVTWSITSRCYYFHHSVDGVGAQCCRSRLCSQNHGLSGVSRTRVTRIIWAVSVNPYALIYILYDTYLHVTVIYSLCQSFNMHLFDCSRPRPLQHASVQLQSTKTASAHLQRGRPCTRRAWEAQVLYACLTSAVNAEHAACLPGTDE
jgi:hypothetical protein